MILFSSTIFFFFFFQFKNHCSHFNQSKCFFFSPIKFKNQSKKKKYFLIDANIHNSTPTNQKPTFSYISYPLFQMSTNQKISFSHFIQSKCFFLQIQKSIQNAIFFFCFSPSLSPSGGLLISGTTSDRKVFSSLNVYL